MCPARLSRYSRTKALRRAFNLADGCVGGVLRQAASCRGHCADQKEKHYRLTYRHIDNCKYTIYTDAVIKDFKHKGLEAFFFHGSKAGIQPSHAKRLQVQLAMLNAAKGPADMGMPGWKLHPLTGNLKGNWSVQVNGNWRMTFTFEKGDAVLVDYQDYH